MDNPTRKIGECIYCFTTEGRLQDEHIVPFGLNGTWILEEASCGRCATKTSAFERNVLRNALRAPRAALGFRSYRRKKVPKAFPLDIDRGAGLERIEVPIEDHPAVAILPHFEPPSWQANRARRNGITVRGATSIYFGRKPIDRFVERYAGSKLTEVINYQPAAFARLIAKIAYGYCVLAFGLDTVRNAYAIPAILGQTDDIGTWVGSTDGYQLELDPQPAGRLLHAVGTDVEHGDIVSYVRLFAWVVPDEYKVIVCPTPETHHDPEAQGRGSDA